MSPSAAPRNGYGSADADRDEDLRVAAFDEQGDGALLALHGTAQLLYRRDRFAVDAEDDVAGLQAGHCGGAAHFLDDKGAFSVNLLLLVSGQRTHCDAELRRLISSALASCGAHG